MVLTFQHSNPTHNTRHLSKHSLAYAAGYHLRAIFLFFVLHSYHQHRVVAKRWNRHYDTLLTGF